MCLAFSAKIVAVKGKKLVVARNKEKIEVISAIENPKKGETVLIQQGFAVEKMP